ncbi:PilZ domain-containing protein [Gilvimarinus sp. F26214L]|uniref:PilZ domain-containing protein n=1 Tax=Gilvimarinus sp. DZF01 TaxID=3461371 RepID=UPI00404621F8
MSDGSLNPSEQRRLPRHSISEPVEIYDRVSQRPVGRVVNIHMEGMMVAGQHAFSAECLYQFDLHLPRAVNGRRVIPVGVDCLWSKREEGALHWAGCKIIDLSEEAQADLQTLIAMLGQPDG